MTYMEVSIIKANELTLEEKIGQMFIIGIPGTEVDHITRYLIKEGKVGGIILYRKNILSVEHLLNLLNSIRDLNRANKVPLFISIDQEGGRVNRMPQEILNVVSAKKVSKCGGELCYESGRVIGKMLRDFGINMDFAPVLDIGGFKDSHALGDRCVGSNAEEVAENGINIMKGIREEKVIPTMKHFPGHGASRADSHLFMPVIYKRVRRLKIEDMYPFIKAINEGAESIMVGHLLVADVNSIYPASLSDKVIKDILRRDLKYKGLVITDDLSMKGITLNFGITHPVVKAIKAGADIIMINKEHKNKKRVLQNVLRLANRNSLKIEEINNSVQRILDIKEKYELSDKYITEYDIQDINDKINELNIKVETKII